MDPYVNCRWRNGRQCMAAPYYGTADCDWAVDKDECPEPGDALACTGCILPECVPPKWYRDMMEGGDA